MSRSGAGNAPARTDPRRRLDLPRSLFYRGLFAAIAFIGPVFGVLYILVLPDGPWRAVVVAQIAVVLLAVAASIAYVRSAIWMGPDSATITERGFFGRLVHFDKSEVESILRANVYTSDGSECRPQLVVLGANNRRLLRMRGQYWTIDDMNAVVEELEVPVFTIPGTVSTSELRRDYPHALYLLERYPSLVVLISIGATALTAGALVLILSIIGSVAA